MWYPRGKSSLELSSHHGMYRCAPPTPSQLWRGWSTSAGMKPPTSVPVESVMYLPTTPLELASPCGWSDDLLLSRMRADSHALAASTTTRASTRSSVPVVLSMYTTPVARPSRPTVTSRAIALVIRVRRPVRAAGASSTLVLEKLALTAQPRLHWPQ